MKTTLDIPEAVAAALKRRAEQSHRTLDEVCVSAIVTGLAAMDLGQDVSSARDLVRRIGRGVERLQSEIGPHAQGNDLKIETDAVTGLPVVISPPGAPIHSMTVDEVLAVEQATLEEEDLERAGLPLRH